MCAIEICMTEHNCLMLCIAIYIRLCRSTAEYKLNLDLPTSKIERDKVIHI